MKRRKFLRNTSLLSLPGLLSGFEVSALAKSSLSQLINDDSDRVLVLVQLDGGNDGLSTIIPLDQQDNIAAVRSNIFIPENRILGITDTLGLHPSMEGIRSLYNNGKIKIIQDVGYPDQNRSHFRSKDIWHTGSESDEYLNTGWIGRYLDNRVDDFPAAYPNEDNPHPFAMTVGSNVSETCEGLTGNFSMAVVNPGVANGLQLSPTNTVISGCAKTNLDFLLKTVSQTNDYGQSIKAIYDKGNNLSAKYADDNALAQKLKHVARLISGGIETKIFVVSLGGFDTHSSQIESGNPLAGRHAELLATLSGAIEAFQEDLQLLGLDQRVLGMTYSEFGRRIRSNASFGTDHGTAAPMFMFGSCLNTETVGSNPTIDRNASVIEGVPMQFDFRSVYVSTLMDWFGVSETELSSLFSDDLQYLSIVSGCDSTTSTQEVGDNFDLQVRPNPFNDNVIVNFSSGTETIKVSLFNAIGQELKVLTNQKLSSGNHELEYNLQGIPSGPYFIRIQNKNQQKTLRLIKI